MQAARVPAGACAAREPAPSPSPVARPAEDERKSRRFTVGPPADVGVAIRRRSGGRRGRRHRAHHRPRRRLAFGAHLARLGTLHRLPVLLRSILLRMPDASPISTRHLVTRTADVGPLVERELARTQGLLRLAPCWVPRAFVQPGRRLKLHPDDLYAFGLDRGGIDERWFASTIEAANAGRVPDEGLSYIVVERERVTLRDAVAACGASPGRRSHLDALPAMARVCEVLRQPRPHSAPHAPGRRAGGARGP